MASTGNVRTTQVRSGDRKGTGTTVQMHDGGATVNGNVAIFDANGNIKDGGAAPIQSGGNTPLSWVTFVAPVDGDFSWVNQGGATITSSASPTRLFLNASAAAGNNIRARVKTAPATPYTVTAWFHPALFIGSGKPNCGLCFRESSSGKLHLWALVYVAASDKTFIQSIKNTSPTVWSANYTSKSSGVLGGSAGICFRIADDGTNRILLFSTDGENFSQYHSVGRTDFLTADQIGYYAESQDATLSAGMLLVSWKQA